MTKHCTTCSDPFDAPDAAAKLLRLCPKCSGMEEKRREVEHRGNIAAKRRVRWIELCPPSFIDTQRDKLPLPPLLDRCLDWSAASGKGLLLHGPTGTGKSRCAWKVVEREFLAGRSVVVLSAMSGIEYAASFEHGAHFGAKFVRRAAAADLLYGDDLFKSRLSDSWESAVFSILNDRCEQHRSFILTMNDCGSTLAERMSHDRAEPLARRLREFCVTIGFVKKGVK